MYVVCRITHIVCSLNSCSHILAAFITCINQSFPNECETPVNKVTAKRAVTQLLHTQQVRSLKIPKLEVFRCSMKGMIAIIYLYTTYTS